MHHGVRNALALTLALTGAGCAGRPSTGAGPMPSAEADPGLVVLVVVDQMRYDLLERYADLWTGGLRRLRAESLRFTNATHDHAVTETAPGHATLATGVHPSRHGVVANLWLEADSSGWRTVENVVDPATPLVGAPEFTGASPDRLRREGLADWLRAIQPQARVVSIAGKDRAAVLMASRARGLVYWYEARLGRFVTSTWYAETDPEWVVSFNEGRLRELLADSVWESTVPSHAVARARPDSASYEGDGLHVTFPHERVREDATPGAWLARTPDLDLATLDLARAALVELDLGRGQRTDYLAIGLSQTDRVGHAFGPYSLEQLDNLLRLDRELGSFLAELEASLPPDRLTLALTADHGVLQAPEWRVAQGLPGRRLGTAERDRYTDIVTTAVRTPPFEPRALRDSLAALDWVAAAWVDARFPADSFASLERNGVYEGRFASSVERFGVGYRMTEGTLDWAWPRGTMHGSPYYYDRHVPLLFFGAEIDAGVVETAVSSTDVAPTLARWVGIPVPGDLDGRPLLGRRTTTGLRARESPSGDGETSRPRGSADLTPPGS
ncbi:MAG: alkaline phosphatase family protein [Gemmatimonadota bacterium]